MCPHHSHEFGSPVSEADIAFSANDRPVEKKSTTSPYIAADTAIDQMKQEAINERLIEIKEQLKNYAALVGLHSLEDRAKRGLFTIGMLAVPEVRIYIENLADKLGAVVNKKQDGTRDGVEDITLDIQRRGPWQYAEGMRADDPKSEMKLYMMMNAVNTIDIPREKDLSPKEFLKHLEHIKILLQEATQNPETFWERAKKENLEKSQERMRYEEGIPISEMDQGFIPAALQGYEAGIIQDADGTPLIGAKNPINSEIFAQWGLIMHEEQDGRGRKVPTYYNPQGQKLFRQLYPGFIVVDAKKFELAAAIVRATEQLAEGVAIEDLEIPNNETLGVAMYVPTSSADGGTGGWEQMHFLRPKLDQTIPGEELSPTDTPKKGTALISVSGDAFYNAMHWIKSHVIALDALDRLEEKKKVKGQNPPTEKEKEELYTKIDEKVDQKMEELKFLMEIIGPELEKLPDTPHKIMDMAGGAGDLGLAVAIQMIADGKQLSKTQIIDPFSKFANLETFTEFIVDHLPLSNKLRDITEHTNESIQQAKITADAIVVAKHPCGDLSDTIIEKWVNSESPLLVIMTCCQDKACGCPARYDISQTDWNNWCRESTRTNVVLPSEGDKKYNSMKEKLISGKQAMTNLDTARVEYLKRHGFNAELIQTDLFPKGDVIVARRR